MALMSSPRLPTMSEEVTVLDQPVGNLFNKCSRSPAPDRPQWEIITTGVAPFISWGLLGQAGHWTKTFTAGASFSSSDNPLS